MPLNTDMVLTPKQAGERLQLPAAHVREMIREGVLPGFRRSKRLWGILLSELEKWLSSRGNQAKEARQFKIAEPSEAVADRGAAPAGDGEPIF